MQGTSKVRSGRAKNKAPIVAREIVAREYEPNAENDETGETFEDPARDEAERAEAPVAVPSGPLRSGNIVMVWFLIPLALVLLYGLFTR